MRDSTKLRVYLKEAIKNDFGWKTRIEDRIAEDEIEVAKKVLGWTGEDPKMTKYAYMSGWYSGLVHQLIELFGGPQAALNRLNEREADAEQIEQLQTKVEHLEQQLADCRKTLLKEKQDE